MKPTLLRRVRARRVLEQAWRAIEENARTSTSESVRHEVQAFAENAGHKLDSISYRLARNRFEFKPAKGIPIPKIGADGKKNKSKFRPIVLAPVESRIVQRAILEALLSHRARAKYSNSPNSYGGVRRQAGRDLAAVPAAVEEILKAIGSGAQFVAFADIRAFFTKIPKSTIHDIVAEAVNEPEFMPLFDAAISVELSNLAELREKASSFPIEDIGVAQGNSLSPLLGNILLHDFDLLMNAGDCRCIRYIDDFIILAPSRKAAVARMKLARELLNKFGMELSPEKSATQPVPITGAFDFLGIEFNNGLIRPGKKARLRVTTSIEQNLQQSLKAISSFANGNAFPKAQSFVAALRRVDGILQGWSKHYWFCNDRAIFANLEKSVAISIANYVNEYRSAMSKAGAESRLTLLGVERVGLIDLEPMTWPKKSSLSVPPSIQQAFT